MLAREQGGAAHILAYNRHPEPVTVPQRLSLPPGVTSFLEPGAGVRVGYRSTLFALQFGGRVTSTGLSIYPEAGDIVDLALAQVEPGPVEAPLEA